MCKHHWVLFSFSPCFVVSFASVVDIGAQKKCQEKTDKGGICNFFFGLFVCMEKVGNFVIILSCLVDEM